MKGNAKGNATPQACQRGDKGVGREHGALEACHKGGAGAENTRRRRANTGELRLLKALALRPPTDVFHSVSIV